MLQVADDHIDVAIRVEAALGRVTDVTQLGEHLHDVAKDATARVDA